MIFEFIKVYLPKLKLKIEQDYNEIKYVYNSVNKFVNYYIERHPAQASVLLGENRMNIDKEFTTKMCKISTIFKIYKDMNITVIKENVANILNYIDDLDKLLENKNLGSNGEIMGKKSGEILNEVLANVRRYEKGLNLNFELDVCDIHSLSNFVFNKDELAYAESIDDMLNLIANFDKDNSFYTILNAIPKNNFFPQVWNDLIGTINYTKYGLPERMFDGKWTSSLSKNILMNVNDVNVKLRQMKSILLSGGKTPFCDLYMMLIITNQLYDENYVIYDYLNKNILLFYQNTINDIIKNLDENEYLKKYHHVTIIKLSKFLNDIIQNMNKDAIINISKCSGEIANGFLLLNYFKIILEKYKSNKINNVSIYAKINTNTNTNGKLSGNNLFIPDSFSSKFLCVGSEKYKFTEVFGDDITNDVLPKYMNLDIHLAQGFGTVVVTCGCGGTGKTFTITNMLRATFDGINGLKTVKFRLFKYNVATNKAIQYNLGVKINTLFNLKQNSSIFLSDICSSNNTYTIIPRALISDLFKNFTHFVGEVAEENMDRDLLVYDFLLEIAGKQVPLLIVDQSGTPDIAHQLIQNSIFDFIPRPLAPFLKNIKIYKFLCMFNNGVEPTNEQYILLKNICQLY